MATVPQFSWQELSEIRAKLNSYLGYMQHANSFNLRKTMLGRLIKRFYDFFMCINRSRKYSLIKNFGNGTFYPVTSLQARL